MCRYDKKLLELGAIGYVAVFYDSAISHTY